MEEFSISTGAREGFQIIVVRGELDELTAPELDLSIDGQRYLWPVVIVDLSDLEFMSSAGLRVLLRDRPERIAIVCPPGNIRRVLDLVHADRGVLIYSDLDTALLSLTLSTDNRQPDSSNVSHR
jgi:anti-anti-sigma factor